LSRKPCIYEGIFINPNLPGTTGFPTFGSEWFIDTLASVTGFGAHIMEANLYSWNPQPTIPVSGAVVKAQVVSSTNFIVDGTYCDGCPFSDTVSVVVNCERGNGRMASPNTNPISMDTKASVYPNPFRGDVTLSISTVESGLVRVEIVNMLGETVAILNNNILPAGDYTFTWGVSADNGWALPDGLYACKIISGNSAQTIMLVKASK
ncbi:MAG: T9SS type A sorting domain-containing protein, partial [Bacteroidia bacterium]